MKFSAFSHLLAGQETHLGEVPDEVKAGDCIMISVPEMGQTYIVAVSKRYGKSAYGKSCREYSKYLEPTG